MLRLTGASVAREEAWCAIETRATLALAVSLLWSPITAATEFQYSATLTGGADPTASATFIGVYDDSAGPSNGTLDFTFDYENLDSLQSLSAINRLTGDFISSFGPFFPNDPDDLGDDDLVDGAITRSTTWFASDNELACQKRMHLMVATLTPNEIGGDLGSSNGDVSVLAIVNGTPSDEQLLGTATCGDRIDGKGGIDTMFGLDGDDIYIVNHVDDMVIEMAEEGNDLVRSSVSYTLPANVERITLTGSAAINATGNELDNTLTGNSGNNRLDGKEGYDTMTGRDGDDTYIADRGRDEVVETVDGGIDLVRSSVTYTLPANVENLTLTGTSAINGSGNALANRIVGNSGDNILNGVSGSDRLTGRDGRDVFRINSPLGPANIDRITDFTPADDIIRLNRWIFSTLPLGPLPPNWFRAERSATTAMEQILYDPATGALFYDKDGTGPVAKVRFATLTNKPALTNAGFLVQ